MIKEAYVSYEIAMIRAKELMIGDWFQTTYPSGRVDYRKVTGNFNNYVNTEDGTTNAIEPIPITPEILEKNGFYPIYKDEKSAYKWKKYDEDDNIQSIIIDFERKRVSEVWSDRTRKSYKGEIVYVHELQQIIKICGISKTIEL